MCHCVVISESLLLVAVTLKNDLIVNTVLSKCYYSKSKKCYSNNSSSAKVKVVIVMKSSFWFHCLSPVWDICLLLQEYKLCFLNTVVFITLNVKYSVF